MYVISDGCWVWFLSIFFIIFLYVGVLWGIQHHHETQKAPATKPQPKSPENTNLCALLRRSKVVFSDEIWHKRQRVRPIPINFFKNSFFYWDRPVFTTRIHSVFSRLGLRWFSGSFRQNQTTIGKFPTCLWQNQNFQATVGRFRHLPKFSNQCSSVRQFLAYILVYRESTRRRTVWKTSILV